MAEPPEVFARVLRLPKRGSTPAEYEDACAFQDRPRLPFRAAVADGATESAFARAWAERLANGWLNGTVESPESFASALAGWQAAWAADVADAAGTLPWYAAAKAEQGSYSTFLGLSIHLDGTWQALAVGDSCLFHIRADGAPISWPLETPEAFNNTPGLVCSLPGILSGPILQTQGRWGRGEAFLLASDAAAAWMMTQNARSVLDLTQESFAERIEAARDAGRIQNDDVTVGVVSLL